MYVDHAHNNNNLLEGKAMAENNTVKTINVVIDWIQTRISKIDSWDSVTIFVISLLVLIASPIVKYAAMLGLVYSGWCLWKRFKPS